MNTFEKDQTSHPSVIPLHICWFFVFHEIASFALPVDTTAMGRSLPATDGKVSGSTTAELWKKAPDDSESEPGGPCSFYFTE